MNDIIDGVIVSENIITFDVDDTLVMWDDPYRPADDKLEFTSVSGTTYYLKPHAKHIELLKDHFNRGYFVIVWSAGGYEWANDVLTTLNLNAYRHLVMSKPTKYVDDLPGNEILGTRIYLNE